MPRISRGLVDDFIYHVLNRGNGGQTIFHKDKDYEAFINIIREARGHYKVKIFAYCLMPNHFHMILMPHHAEDLSKFMQWLMTSHVRRYHQHYGTRGHLWQGRYKSFLIQKDNHLLAVIRYIEGNPKRAGLVNSAKDWLWSSCRETIKIKNHSLIDEIPIELPTNWEEYINKPLTMKELERLRQSVIRQSPYGNESWQLRVSQDLGLESTIRPRGRPRKNYDKN
jgi:putative transposase